MPRLSHQRPTSFANHHPIPPVDMDDRDPFVTSAPREPAHLRYSNFDAQLFGPGVSADQAKRALEAHLQETDRRIEDAAKLGTSLVSQRNELEDKLKEVEKLQAEAELSPELRQRLVEIEKDYNDVARESARAFMPKSRVPSNETVIAGSPFAPEGKGGRRSVSPSKFESHGTGSPTKLTVPNRKLRNQPSTRVHDIEFAAEISQSLIAQVRNLQTLLAEREEELRDAKLDNSVLEREAEGFQQRVKALDESEHRYKDENWNLETQLHEMRAAQRDAADREKKLSQSLTILTAEKSAAQRELDEVKLAHAKLSEEHVSAAKHYDIELGTAKRSIAMAENERATMQRKIEELTTRNQELAKAFSVQRGRMLERDGQSGMSEEDFESATDNLTPEHSPPPSPVKATPRHSMLESETMRTSFQHLQRQLQLIRSNLHREKTEKLELRRMLQESRDEVERLRREPTPSSAKRHAKKLAPKEFKKPKVGQLGALRATRHEVYNEDPDWEEVDYSPTRSSAMLSPTSSLTRLSRGSRGSDEAVAILPSVETDHFETAHETTDAAFETANERATETEDFQTGAEEFSEDDDEGTETEILTRAGSSSKPTQSASLSQRGNRTSFHSTASTSGDEGEYFSQLRTPTVLPPPQKTRFGISRFNVSRRSLSSRVSEEPHFASSPAGFAAGTSSRGTTPGAGQSLYAELGDLDGSDDDSFIHTPSRRSARSMTPASTARARTASPPPEVPPLPRVIMIDSGMQTELVEPTVVTPLTAVPKLATVDTAAGSDSGPPSPVSIVTAHHRSASGDAGVDADASKRLTVGTIIDSEVSRPLSTISSAYSDTGAQFDPDIESKLALFPAPPLRNTHILPPPQTLVFSSVQSIIDIEPMAELEKPSPVLTISTISVEQVTPIEASIPELTLSNINSESVEPKVEPEVPPPALSLSPLVSEQVNPVAEPAPEPPALTLSNMFSQNVEPIAEPAPTFTLSTVLAEGVAPVAEPTPNLPVLSISPIVSEMVDPVAALEAPRPDAPELTLSSVVSKGIEPIVSEEAKVESPTLSISAIMSEGVEPIVPVEPKFETPVLGMSAIISEDITPITPEEPKQVKSELGMSVIVSEAFAPISQPTTPKPIPTLSVIKSENVEPVLPPSPVTVAPAPILGFTSVEIVANTEPLSPRSPKRDGFIIPRDLSLHPGLDQSSQTALTSDEIDRILAAKTPTTPDKSPLSPGLLAGGVGGTPSTVRRRQSQESVNSIVRHPAKGKTPDYEQDVLYSGTRRPGSASSTPAAADEVPPLPFNHKQAIEAARAGSTNPGVGTITPMGPPLVPASAMRNTSFRPITPSGQQRPMSPTLSGRGTPTPRPVRAGSSHGQGSLHSPAGVASPTRLNARSRQSSVSSFVSEIDNRFHMQDGIPMGPGNAFGSSTDPRMIRAITDTMIGEYLYKYTRKPGSREMSENRHRRYFWVHPYTRTLYWSEHDPQSAKDRGQLKAKSVPIDAVRVVTDDNHVPPGLHRKSLVVVAPGRTIKFTCTTGQRHETWFNALSYLLLRTNDDEQNDAEETAGNITREDVDEFNPQYNRRPVNGHRLRAPPSLSSYNSRTTGTQSPALDMSMNIPTLTPQGRKVATQRPSIGTLSRISGYWKSGTFSSLRSRSTTAQPSIYEASEAHDSAEDLREMIVRQDRESDKLENVRACCDGKHDVGTLSHVRRSRPPPSHAHTHTGATSSNATPMSTLRSRA